MAAGIGSQLDQETIYHAISRAQLKYSTVNPAIISQLEGVRAAFIPADRIQAVDRAMRREELPQKADLGGGRVIAWLLAGPFSPTGCRCPHLVNPSAILDSYASALRGYRQADRPGLPAT